MLYHCRGHLMFYATCTPADLVLSSFVIDCMQVSNLHERQAYRPVASHTPAATSRCCCWLLRDSLTAW